MSQQSCWNAVQGVRWVWFSICSHYFQNKSCQPIINLFHGGGLEIKRDRVTYIHLVGFQFDYCGVQPRLGKRWLTTMHFAEFSVGFSLFLFASLISYTVIGFSNLVRWSLSSPKYSEIKSSLIFSLSKASKSCVATRPQVLRARWTGSWLRCICTCLRQLRRNKHQKIDA